ncbi:hypothetical protein DL767_010899 [Monosporascus sp. MG133]|nr:hypothetical protein DL767_010899 [Monosporascus sp. MG133]
MQYATQPVGERRFATIDWPEPFEGVKEATRYSKQCIQDVRTPLEEQDEACLTFNVYRTHGVSFDEKLPVLVWIHGGAFLIGGWDKFDGPSFVASSPAPIVVVTFQYRLNSFGSLPSRLFADKGLLNLGLRDQHFFLKQFIQRHISSFGGDPNMVTLGGRSAGAYSVGFHYFHNYGEDADAPYFARAIHQSGAATSRGFPNATSPHYVDQFEVYTAYLNCTEGDDEEILACLRAANVSDIRDVSLKLYYDSVETESYPFQPVQGGPLLEKFGSESGYDGTFHKLPVITSTVTDEGILDVPGTLETNEDFISYFSGVSPKLTDNDLALLGGLYPDPAVVPGSPFTNSPNSTQLSRVSAAYSDYVAICPGQETAYRASREGVPTWKVRFNTNDSWPAWQGIPHGADERYTWNEPQVQYPRASSIYHAYLASFVATGDPNTLRYPGSPKWPRYEPSWSEKEMDGAPPRQLVLQLRGEAAVELDNIRWDACQYWRDPERAPRLNK